MRIILIFFIFTSLLAQTFSKGIIFAQFFFNQDYIANNLCENKDIPEMECNGHCHLNKELKKEEEKQKTNFQSEKQEVVLFYQVAYLPLQEAFSVLLISNYFHYNDPKVLNISAEVFHPPS